MTTKEPISRELIERTIVDIDGYSGDEDLMFTLDNGNKYKLYVDKDCCGLIGIYIKKDVHNDN